MAGYYTESNYENAVFQLFQEQLGYTYIYGPDVARDYHSPLYEDVLLPALQRINRKLPMDAINEAVYQLKNFETGTLLQKNMVFMDYLQNGVPVKYYVASEERSALVYLIDYKNPANNDFTVVNQWTFIENSEKRPDVILFVNGLPLVVVELKSPSREETDASAAYRQLRNYMGEIPTLFIGFTGTPISSKDRSTREVFGDYIDIYDMTQAVEDGATRPVYYESRVIHLKLDENTLRLIDTEYDIMAQNADPYVIEKSKKELGQMEAILGADQTVDSLVGDILDHYESFRANILTGKAMIVAYSRPIALGLTAEELAFYDALTKPQAIKDFYEHKELIAITKELTDLLRRNRTIDWQKKESARAGMRKMVKRLLRKHQYPPEGMEDAVRTVMSQCEMWMDNAF